MDEFTFDSRRVVLQHFPSFAFPALRLRPQVHDRRVIHVGEDYCDQDARGQSVAIVGDYLYLKRSHYVDS